MEVTIISPSTLNMPIGQGPECVLHPELQQPQEPKIRVYIPACFPAACGCLNGLLELSTANSKLSCGLGIDRT